MGHPCEYYVRFLLARSWADPEQQQDITATNLTLDAYGLPSLWEKHYDAIRAAFDPPANFKFNSRKHPDTRAFMKASKIYALWCPNEDSKRVLTDILDGNQLYRHKIHLLLMGRVPYKVIAEKLNRTFRINPPITEKMIATYHHYFWSVGSSRQDEWSELLRGFQHRDAFMASLHCGDQQALYRAGYKPKVPIKGALRDLHRQIHFRLEALHAWPDTASTFTALSTLGIRMEKLYEILHGEGAGAEDQLARLRTILLKHKVADVETIDSWIDTASGGSISGDGSEKEEAEEETEDEAEDEDEAEEGDQNE